MAPTSYAPIRRSSRVAAKPTTMMTSAGFNHNPPPMIPATLIVNPANVLEFTGPFTHRTQSVLTLQNDSATSRFAYKIKSTAGKGQLAVSPPRGIVEPKQSINVTFTMMPVSKKNPNLVPPSHRVMVQSIVVDHQAIALDSIWQVTMWKKLMTHKLRCMYNLPPTVEDHHNNQAGTAGAVVANNDWDNNGQQQQNYAWEPAADAAAAAPAADAWGTPAADAWGTPATDAWGTNTVAADTPAAATDNWDNNADGNWDQQPAQTDAWGNNNAQSDQNKGACVGSPTAAGGCCLYHHSHGVEPTKAVVSFEAGKDILYGFLLVLFFGILLGKCLF